MGHMKELFLSIQQGMMEGINIERAERERMLDDEYRLKMYSDEDRDLIREVESELKENNHGE
mgnify:CR=1 FL=1|jgi:hypothetical protein|tara:strand:+ start:1066 stop:1251 length:186 start_codon:yes stop_codon:yes gene_type:complete